MPFFHGMGMFAASNTYVRIPERDNNYIFMNPGQTTTQHHRQHRSYSADDCVGGTVGGASAGSSSSSSGGGGHGKKSHKSSSGAKTTDVEMKRRARARARHKEDPDPMNSSVTKKTTLKKRGPGENGAVPRSLSSNDVAGNKSSTVRPRVVKREKKVTVEPL
jgi:hypothetical protein